MKRQTTCVRVATLVPLSPATIGPQTIGGEVAGIFFEGEAVLCRRRGYEHLDLSKVPMRHTVTSSSSGRLLRASFYVPIGDRLVNRQAAHQRGDAG